MMTPISLKDCAWDKENATLTTPLSTFKSENWGEMGKFRIESHVTGTVFTFEGGTTKNSFRDHNRLHYWRCRPLDHTCPIKHVFIIDSNWDNDKVYVEQLTAHKTWKRGASICHTLSA